MTNKTKNPKNQKKQSVGCWEEVEEVKYDGTQANCSQYLALHLHGLQGTWSWGHKLKGFIEPVDRVYFCYKIGSHSVHFQKLDSKIKIRQVCIKINCCEQWQQYFCFHRGMPGGEHPLSHWAGMLYPVGPGATTSCLVQNRLMSLIHVDSAQIHLHADDLLLILLLSAQFCKCFEQHWV